MSYTKYLMPTLSLGIILSCDFHVCAMGIAAPDSTHREKLKSLVQQERDCRIHLCELKKQVIYSRWYKMANDLSVLDGVAGVVAYMISKSADTECFAGNIYGGDCESNLSLAGPATILAQGVGLWTMHYLSQAPYKTPSIVMPMLSTSISYMLCSNSPYWLAGIVGGVVRVIGEGIYSTYKNKKFMLPILSKSLRLRAHIKDLNKEILQCKSEKYVIRAEQSKLGLNRLWDNNWARQNNKDFIYNAHLLYNKVLLELVDNYEFEQLKTFKIKDHLTLILSSEYEQEKIDNFIKNLEDMLNILDNKGTYVCGELHKDVESLLDVMKAIKSNYELIIRIVENFRNIMKDNVQHNPKTLQQLKYNLQNLCENNEKIGKLCVLGLREWTGDIHIQNMLLSIKNSINIDQLSENETNNSVQHDNTQLLQGINKLSRLMGNNWITELDNRLKDIRNRSNSFDINEFNKDSYIQDLERYINAEPEIEQWFMPSYDSLLKMLTNYQDKLKKETKFAELVEKLDQWIELLHNNNRFNKYHQFNKLEDKLNQKATLCKNDQILDQRNYMNNTTLKELVQAAANLFKWVSANRDNQDAVISHLWNNKNAELEDLTNIDKRSFGFKKHSVDKNFIYELPNIIASHTEFANNYRMLLEITNDAINNWQEHWISNKSNQTSEFQNTSRWWGFGLFKKNLNADEIQSDELAKKNDSRQQLRTALNKLQNQPLIIYVSNLLNIALRNLDESEQKQGSVRKLNNTLEQIRKLNDQAKLVVGGFVR